MLEFLVVNQEITRRDDRIVVADSINYLVANFMFASSEWTGEKTAIFKNDSVGTAYSVLLTNNSCIVPWEIIKTGTLSVSVFCSTLVTANECEILVEPSGYVSGQTPQPPTQDVYNQIIALLESNITPEALETALEDYYTKIAMDEILNDYATTENVATALQDYSTTLEIETILSAYATDQEVATLLQSYLTESQIDTLLESYVTTQSLSTTLEDYLTEEEINTLLTSYYTSAQVDTLLEDYSTTTEIGTMLEDYVTETELSNTLEDYPTRSEISGGSGYESNIYLTAQNSLVVPAYYALSYLNDANATESSHTVTSSSEVLLRTFLYDTQISTTFIDSGTWKFTTYVKQTAINKDTRLRLVVFKRSSTGVETELFTTTSNNITNTTYEVIKMEMYQPYLTVATTDRLGIKVYASTNANTNTVSCQVGDGYGCYINTPLTLRHDLLRDKNGNPLFQHVTSDKIEVLDSLTIGEDNELYYGDEVINPIESANIDFSITNKELSLAKRDKIQNKVRDYMFKSMFTQWNTAYLNDVIKQQVFPTYTKVTSTSTSNKQAFCGQTLINGHTYYFMINSKTNSGTTVKAKISLSASPFTEYAYVNLPISAVFSNKGFLYTNNTGTDKSCQLSIQEPASNSLDIDLAYCVLLDITGTDLMNLTWQEITDNYVNNVDLFKDNYLYFDIPTKLDELYDDSALTLWNRKNTLRYNRNFLRVSGTNIVDANGIRFLMRGINEGNDCTTINSSAGSDMIATTNGYPESHNEDSYRELRDLGFNCLRFQFAYTFFEGANNPVIDATYQGLPSQYQAKAWEWLDREVALARKYNIKLLFNMHVCPGMGGWEVATADMWTTANSRIRLVNMWKAIARRYANEDIVLGFGLINEPVITFQTDNATTIGVYQTLINTLCTEIRKVDTNHILVVENALRASNGTTALNSNNNFVDVLNNGVTDTNYLYEAHIYHNMAITHEMSTSKHPSINYPNEFAAWNYGSQYDWVANASQFISIPVGTADQTGWTDYYTPITTPNALCKIIYPWIRVRDANGGEILQMCDYGIDIYDSSDAFVETIFSDNAQFGAIFNGGGLGTMTNPQLQGATTIGYMQLVANALSGYTTTSSMSDVPVSTRYRIPTGYKYRIRAKYRVSNIPSSGVAFRFYIGCDEINTANYTDTEERFKYNINLYKGSADAKNIPLHVGEFGSNYASFLTLPRGGELWVRDALKVLRELQIDYSFFSYCGSLFSMYTNVNRDDAKQTILYDVIIQHFNEMTIEEIDAIIDNI
jgi:hypothetical protein